MSRAIPSTLRRLVADRAEGLCEYCLLHETDTYFGCEVDQATLERIGDRRAVLHPLAGDGSLKVLLIPEDPQLDQYILRSVVTQLFADLGNAPRVAAREFSP